MKIAYINPNSTEAMTDGIAAAAQAAVPSAEIFGLTNSAGPAAIQGQDDGEAAIPGLLDLLPIARQRGAEAIVIACFDDTGLAQARAVVDCPVIGIGQASYVMAHLLGLRFSVITSMAISVPVIEENIRQSGFAPLCASVRASALPVLVIDEGGPAVIGRISAEIERAIDEDGAGCAILGCAGMAHLRASLAARVAIPLIDGVAASARLCMALGAQ
ncbi:aspartate/glutamate racemase family protein [Roseovarius sp.]|uniref:aspartate/glutamate racemase family protein n=1 Tax=Roseovarius sp. TaxID=1486281 RepID=UPI00262732F8|nr:aspartate/glutamate racemase family protein [Roseovarius sp.]